MGGKEVSISAQIWHFKISTPSHVVVLLQISSVKNPVQGNNSAAYFLPIFVPTRGQPWLNSRLHLELENWNIRNTLKLKPILSQCKNLLLANFPSTDNNDVNIVYNSLHPQEKKIFTLA